jgi:ribose/xylose/arabinose/galactoside ABC-type transport system permease subunit
MTSDPRWQVPEIGVRGMRRRWGTADWGSLPIVLGLCGIWLIFWLANDKFLSPLNLTNLMLQIAALGTLAINVFLVLLLGEIARRLVGSDAALFWAPALWAVNCGLAPVMCWTSIYNQALCAFFLLLAFYFLLRHVETGEPRFWKAQWVAFLLGFGALETNVVYPAIAVVFVALRAPKLLKKTLWLFAASAAFIAVHWWFAPAPDEADDLAVSVLPVIG